MEDPCGPSCSTVPAASGWQRCRIPRQGRTDRRQGGLLRDLRHRHPHHGRRVPAHALPDHAGPRVRRHRRGHRPRRRDGPAGRRPGGGRPVDLLRLLPALPGRPGNLCENWAAIGDTIDGAFAEYVAVPADNAYRLPDGFDGQAAAMIEPLACAVHGLRRLGPVFGDSVVLTGAGTMGLLLLQLLVHAGAGPVTVVDRVSERLEVASKLGAARIVSDLASWPTSASRSRSTRPACRPSIDRVGLLDRGGRLLVFGGRRPRPPSASRRSASTMTRSPSPGRWRSAQLRPGRGAAHPRRGGPAAAAGAPLPLKEWGEALRRVRSGQGIKWHIGRPDRARGGLAAGGLGGRGVRGRQKGAVIRRWSAQETRNRGRRRGPDRPRRRTTARWTRARAAVRSTPRGPWPGSGSRPTFLGRLAGDGFGALLRSRLTGDGVTLGVPVPATQPSTLAVADVDQAGSPGTGST